MGAEHTFLDNLQRDNCRTQGWLEAGAEFHHAETAAQELSGEIAVNILCHMKIWTGGCEKRRRHRDGCEALGRSTVCAGRTIFSVQGGRFALCLHPGVMGDQLPAKSVEGKKHRCQNKLGCLLTEGPGWKKTNPLFSRPASTMGFSRRREAVEGKFEVLHHQDLILKVPAWVLPFMSGVQVCFLCSWRLA